MFDELLQKMKVSEHSALMGQPGREQTHTYGMRERSLCPQQGNDQRSSEGPEEREKKGRNRKGGREVSSENLVPADPEFRSEHCHLSKVSEP
jgi:hypothetical protein